MDSDGFFDFVKGYTSRPIGGEIEIADIPSHPPITLIRVISYAACFVVVISLSIFAYMWNTVDYSVYMDINPSVDMQFNSFKRLKSITPINEDGTQLLDGLKLSGSVAETVPALIMAADEKGYLSVVDGETAVLISVVARHGGSSDAFIASIIAALDKHNMLGFTSIEGCSEELNDRAASLGVSPGKLKLAEALILASDMPLSLREALAMPIKSLFMAVRELGTGIVPDVLVPLNPYADNNDPNTDAGDNKPANPATGQNSNPVVDIQVTPNADPGDNTVNVDSSRPNDISGATGFLTPGKISPSAGPGSSAGSPSQINPGVGPVSPGTVNQPNTGVGPGSNPGSTGQDDPNTGADDSIWITDYNNANSGTSSNPENGDRSDSGTGSNANPGNDDTNNPGSSPDNGNSNGGNGGSNGSKKPNVPGPDLPKPTEGYVEPDCEHDGYWWFQQPDDDQPSYIYNPDTALGHNWNMENIFWDGTGWYGVCLRCGWAGYISNDITYFKPKDDNDADKLSKLNKSERTAVILSSLTEAEIIAGLSYADRTVRLVVVRCRVRIDLVLCTDVNNINQKGEVDLGSGYFLIFDIAGNGSQIKEFKIAYRNT